jgi:hypothetical protein
MVCGLAVLKWVMNTITKILVGVGVTLGTTLGAFAGTAHAAAPSTSSAVLSCPTPSFDSQWGLPGTDYNVTHWACTSSAAKVTFHEFSAPGANDPANVAAYLTGKPGNWTLVDNEVALFSPSTGSPIGPATGCENTYCGLPDEATLSALDAAVPFTAPAPPAAPAPTPAPAPAPAPALAPQAAPATTTPATPALAPTTTPAPAPAPVPSFAPISGKLNQKTMPNFTVGNFMASSVAEQNKVAAWQLHNIGVTNTAHNRGVIVAGIQADSASPSDTLFSVFTNNMDLSGLTGSGAEMYNGSTHDPATNSSGNWTIILIPLLIGLLIVAWRLDEAGFINFTRKNSRMLLIIASALVLLTNSLNAWSASGGDGSQFYSNMFAFHVYLWLMLLTGWGLYLWTRNHEMSRKRIWLFMIIGPVVAFIVVLILAFLWIGHQSKHSPLMNGTRLDGLPSGAIADPNGPYIAANGLRYR